LTDAELVVRQERFQGPPELLWLLLARRELDPASVRLAAVLAAYVRAVRSGRLPPERLGRLLVLGAQLLALKGRLLLPGKAPPAFGADEEEETESARHLARYRELQACAQALAARFDPVEPQLPLGRAAARAEELAPEDPSCLLEALRRARRRARRPAPRRLPPAGPSVAELGARLRAALSRAGCVRLWPWPGPPPEAIPALLAALELCRQGEAQLVQPEPFGSVDIRRKEGRAVGAGASGA
jgi:chromatin segregation and condensation protein Rec8/ScpA/Scc1 (kleisin family)